MLGSMPMFTEECQWPQTAGGWENVQPISSEKQRVNRQAFRFSNTPCATLRHIVCVCEIAIPLGTPTDYPAMLAREAWWSVGHCRPTVHSAVAKAALLFHFSQCYSRSFIQPKQSSTRTLWPLASRLYACRDRPGRISRDPRNAPPFGNGCPGGHKHTHYLDLAALHWTKKAPNLWEAIYQLIRKNSNCYGIRRSEKQCCQHYVTRSSAFQRSTQPTEATSA